MQVSAELRWFWEGDCPDEISAWFGGTWWTAEPVRLQQTDEYFMQPGNVEISCKLNQASSSASRRSSEVKALITRFDRNGIELWRKWDWYVPSDAASVIVHKDRYMRLCSTFGSASGFHGEVPLNEQGNPRNAGGAPDDTCRIALSRIRVDGFDGFWWTLCLESCGDLPSAPLALARSLDMLNPPVSGGSLRNYPQFLNGLIASPQARSRIENDLIV